jgi:outer membrane protein assembly factor BamB
VPCALTVLAVCLEAACGGGVRPRTPLFPAPAAWKTLLGDFVTSLVTDHRRLYVSARDGSVRALEPVTGEVTWKVEGFPGQLSAGEGTLLVRGDDGTLTSLHPRTGRTRWQLKTEIVGALAAVLDGDRAFVAGQGVAAVELASGRLLWRESKGSESSAPPAPAGTRLLVGEKDGTLRSRDRATGASLWTLGTGSALLAPPLVDLERRRAYLGTTDKRIVSLRLDDGRPGWRWRVGADVADAGLLWGDRVLFASYDAVLWALHPGGNLAWRGSLPSRPLSPPLLVSGYVLVACLENELVAFTPESGRQASSLRTAAEIRTPPVVAGGVLAVGLRDRSVVGYSIGTPEPAAPAPPEPAGGTVEGPPPGRLD